MIEVKNNVVEEVKFSTRKFLVIKSYQSSTLNTEVLFVSEGLYVEFDVAFHHVQGRVNVSVLVAKRREEKSMEW